MIGMHRHCIFNYFVPLLGKCEVYMFTCGDEKTSCWNCLFPPCGLQGWHVPGLVLRVCTHWSVLLVHLCLKIQSITAEPPFPPALVIKSLHRQKVGGKTACAGGSIPCQRGVCLPVCLPPRCAQSLRTFVCAFYSADSADWFKQEVRLYCGHFSHTIESLIAFYSECWAVWQLFWDMFEPYLGTYKNKLQQKEGSFWHSSWYVIMRSQGRGIFLPACVWSEKS